MLHHERPSIRAQLLEKRETLLHTFNEAVIGGLPQAAFGDVGDALEEDDCESARILDLMEELLEVDAALERITDGDYGFCRRCGEKIGQRRLETQPATQFCSMCALEITDE